MPGSSSVNGHRRASTPPVSAPADVSLPLPGGRPGYYVVVAGREVVVRASGDGHVTGSVAIPVPAGNAISPVGGEPRPGKLRQLNFDSRGVPVIGAALSPDGKMLALSLVQEFPPGPLYGSVEVINVASGTTQTWTGPGCEGGTGRAFRPGPTTVRSWSAGGTTPATA